jgi:glycosyltransferase involved in cell wall biosynthesis
MPINEFNELILRMKILHVFPGIPAPPTSGGNLRVFHILKHLCRYHDVTAAGFRGNGDMDYFKRAFPELHGKMHFVKQKPETWRRLRQALAYFSNHSYWYRQSRSNELKQLIQNLLDRRDFDVFQIEYASMGFQDFETDALRILDAHNVEYDNFRRMSTLKWSKLRKSFYYREYKKCFTEEINAFKQQDALFVTSEPDGALIARDVPDIPRFVVPNGVDMAYFKSKEDPIEPFSIVFTGAMKYVPNFEGMIWFLDEIFPLIKKKIPEAKIWIVGTSPPPRLKAYQSDDVIITGFVDDVRPYVDKASVFVVPLRMGSGTRLKVMEALAMQKPVVSTSIGCEGIEVEDDRHLMIRDDPEEFAEAVIELFKNKKMRQKFVDNGYDLVRQKYDWQVIGQSIENAFETLTKKNRMAVSE